MYTKKILHKSVLDQILTNFEPNVVVDKTFYSPNVAFDQLFVRPNVRSTKWFRPNVRDLMS